MAPMDHGTSLIATMNGDEMKELRGNSSEQNPISYFPVSFSIGSLTKLVKITSYINDFTLTKEVLMVKMKEYQCFLISLLESEIVAG